MKYVLEEDLLSKVAGPHRARILDVTEPGKRICVDFVFGIDYSRMCLHSDVFYEVITADSWSCTFARFRGVAKAQEALNSGSNAGAFMSYTVPTSDITWLSKGEPVGISLAADGALVKTTENFLKSLSD